MLKILELHSEGTIGNKIKARCEISVGSSSELATETSDTVFTDGSIAWDISTGDFYGLSGGEWINQSGAQGD
jgi:hypothetical protein